MGFKIAELKQLLSSVAKHQIENIYIKGKHLQLVVNTLKQQNQSILKADRSPKPIKEEATNKDKKISTKEQSATSQKQNTYFTIISPMIGTFYRSPAPNEAPFIEINDPVKINQTVCIIEAMKLMNEIESEVNGDIVEILVKDGDIVDCGQALMRVKQHKI